MELVKIGRGVKWHILRGSHGCYCGKPAEKITARTGGSVAPAGTCVWCQKTYDSEQRWKRY